MPEQRARTHHRNRVTSTFADEIGAMLEGELADPRIVRGYVTQSFVAPGGQGARVVGAGLAGPPTAPCYFAGVVLAPPRKSAPARVAVPCPVEEEERSPAGLMAS